MGQSSQSIIMVYMFNHWLSKYYVNDFSWDTFPQKIMGILESRPAQTSSTPSSSPTETPSQQTDEQFKTEVRKSAENFKNLVMNNKIMMFSPPTAHTAQSQSGHWMTWAHSFKAW